MILWATEALKNSNFGSDCGGSYLKTIKLRSVRTETSLIDISRRADQEYKYSHDFLDLLHTFRLNEYANFPFFKETRLKRKVQIYNIIFDMRTVSKYDVLV